MSARRRWRGRIDSFLLASLRTDGSPANLIGYPAPVMVAAAELRRSSHFSRWPRRIAAAPEPAEAASLRLGSGARTRPEPVRVAAVAEAPAGETAPIPEAEPVAIRQPQGAVPLPPSRPFDLGSNRNTLVVAAARRRQASAPSCRRAVLTSRRARKRRSTSPLSFRPNGRRPAPSSG